MSKQPTYFDLNKLCPHYPEKCEKCQHRPWCWKYNHCDEVEDKPNANS